MSQLLMDIAISLILILGISQFRAPRSARFGNLTAAFALLLAIIVVLVRHGVTSIPLIVMGAGIGVAVGWLLARSIHMIQIPSMVAFQHGMGGVAAFLVSFVELTRTSHEPLSNMAETSALLGLIIGAATFSGSMIAAGKLANKLRQTPVFLPAHNLVLAATVIAAIALAVTAGLVSGGNLITVLAVFLVCLAAVIGIVFSIRIGGADMPVLISFLNATAGLAAAFCGLTIGSRLLIICGATVAASGSVLTHVMCRAMNRSLLHILAGRQQQGESETTISMLPETDEAAEQQTETAAEAPSAEQQSADPLEQALGVARQAQRVIIIPGYGMALADAQEEVVQLADKLNELGKEIIFAIHPVAGRMPGHMHVLLAEADVDYGMIRELQDVNDEFAQTDLALIVGACDVVNPAAIESNDTPISGMPILKAYEAKSVIVCNLDERPGYSGVENQLYRNPKTILLLGDAKGTVGQLLQQLN